MVIFAVRLVNNIVISSTDLCIDKMGYGRKRLFVVF